MKQDVLEFLNGTFVHYNAYRTNDYKSILEWLIKEKVIISNILMEKPDNNDLVDSFIIETEKYNFIFFVYGDCCSVSYINSIEDGDVLKGNYLIGYEEKVMDMEENEYRGEKIDIEEYLEVYNIDLKTNKGTCTIDFRNESNGYYGGYIGEVKLVRRIV